MTTSFINQENEEQKLIADLIHVKFKESLWQAKFPSVMLLRLN